MIKNLLILCTGNICRSPMAEAIFREQLKAQGLETQVHSAGTHALVGNPAHHYAEAVMREKGYDIESHRARQLTIEISMVADLILVMEQAQQKWVTNQFPLKYGRIHRLGRWQDMDIADPYLHSRAIFEETFDVIKQCVEDWQVIFKSTS